MSLITVIDYGVGNLFSVKNAFIKLGFEVLVTDNPEKVAKADRLVLPGVGAFKVGMQNLTAIHMDKAIFEFLKSGNPMIGICLGMQMLVDDSSEYGNTPGLGIIPGKVLAIPVTTASGTKHKIPHIGWCPLSPPQDAKANAWQTSPLEPVTPGTSFYFVHSFAVNVKDRKDLLAVTDYNGREIAAAIRKDNVMGTQFHPEKSGPVGLEILAAFGRS